MVDVKMKYSSMEKMAKEFTSAGQQIETSMREMQKIAKMLNEGALLGDGGKQMEDALLQKLIPRMKKLAEKMKELNVDIKQAVSFTKDGVQTARNRFTN